MDSNYPSPYNTLPMTSSIRLLLFLILPLLSGCQSFHEAYRAKPIAPLRATIELKADDPEWKDFTDLTVKLDNYEEGVHLSQKFEGKTVQVEGVIPGIYTISVSGTASSTHKETFLLKGNQVNYPLFEGQERVQITMNGLKVSPLVFKEIYYAGSRTPLKAIYFRDQYYEIYNNSGKTIYLDGIYFANLHPDKSTKKVPIWPESDAGKYVYARRIWKFPGAGKDYPLASGESVIIAQFAANHKLPQYNPLSPADLSGAEFEFNMDNPKFPDQPAIDMVHVFYDGSALKGRIPQYLTPVFGGAFILFAPPENEEWDPVSDQTLQTPDLGTSAKTLYAKVPIRYVLDAVECIDNESMAGAKRVAPALDAGMTWVGSTYNGLAVTRKPQPDEDGNPLTWSTGAFILQDTNDSSEDFERGVPPILRRYGAKKPSWSTSQTN